MFGPEGANNAAVWLDVQRPTFLSQRVAAPHVAAQLVAARLVAARVLSAFTTSARPRAGTERGRTAGS